MKVLGASFVVFIVIFFLFLIAIVLGIVFTTHKSHKKVTNGIANYDSSMRKFVYKIYLSKEDIVNLLKTKNEIDELFCEFNFKKSTVNISEYGSCIEYYFRIQECNGFSILNLEQVTFVGMQSYIPYKLNPFMINKLNAEIVPFSQFGI